MADWRIQVYNKTGDSGAQGKDVNVMLFQTVPDPLKTDSYSNAWRVRDIQYPGSIGPIDLPEKVDFFVIDDVDGDKRETGPYNVEFGQEVEVTQKNKTDAPTVKIVSGGSGQKGQIKATNMSGNAKSLEMALFKNGASIVSFKIVHPKDSVYLSIEPTIYIADIEGIVEGEDFKAALQATKSTKFQLFAAKRDVKIQITQKQSGELEFSEMA